MRLAAALLVLGAASCGGRAVASGPGSGADEVPPAACPAPRDPPLIDVWGVDCYPGGPPTGACSAVAAACAYCALPILCSPTYGPRTFYSCTCSGGAWACTVGAQDATVCAVPDASDIIQDAAEMPDTIGSQQNPWVTSDGAVCPQGEIACQEFCGPSSATSCHSSPCPPVEIATCMR